MAKILKFKHKLSYYLNLIDKRKAEKDLWGVLEATKSAMCFAKTKNKNGLFLLLAQVYFKTKNYAQSNFCFFKALESPHLKAGAFFGIGRNLICLNHFSLALDYFEICLDHDVFNLFGDAVLKWTSFVKEKMNNPEFANQNLQETAKQLLMEKNFNEAKQILQTLKTDNTTLKLLAICAFFEKDFFSAKNNAKELLKQDEKNVTAKLILFEIYNAQAKTVSAQKLFDELKTLAPQTEEDAEKLGLFFSRHKNFELAQKAFKNLIVLNEFSPKNHLFYALSCHNNGDMQNALFHLSQAKWLDVENPIYDFFTSLVKEGFEKMEVSKKLPKPIEEQKLKNLFEVFFSGKFCEEAAKSHTLIFDVEWCFSLNNFQITNTASSALCSCKNKKSINLAKKLLLLPMPAKQKFAITKNVLFSNNFFNINLVSNFKYSSFCVSKTELEKLGWLKKGVCKAVSFAECFFAEFRLLPHLFKRAKQNKKNQFLLSQPSSLVACFLLFPWSKVFESACMFFGVNKAKIESICSAEKNLENKSDQI